MTLTTDPREAVAHAAPSTPTCGPAWGRRPKPNSAAATFADYQVNAQLMALAPKEPTSCTACRPTRRRSDRRSDRRPAERDRAQAANRLHVQKGILAWLLGAQA